MMKYIRELLGELGTPLSDREVLAKHPRWWTLDPTVSRERFLEMAPPEIRQQRLEEWQTFGDPRKEPWTKIPSLCQQYDEEAATQPIAETEEEPPHCCICLEPEDAGAPLLAHCAPVISANAHRTHEECLRDWSRQNKSAGLLYAPLRVPKEVQGKLLQFCAACPLCRQTIETAHRNAEPLRAEHLLYATPPYTQNDRRGIGPYRLQLGSLVWYYTAMEAGGTVAGNLGVLRGGNFAPLAGGSLEDILFVEPLIVKPRTRGKAVAGTQAPTVQVLMSQVFDLSFLLFGLIPWRSDVDAVHEKRSLHQEIIDPPMPALMEFPMSNTDLLAILAPPFEGTPAHQSALRLRNEQAVRVLTRPSSRRELIEHIQRYLTTGNLMSPLLEELRMLGWRNPNQDMSVEDMLTRIIAPALGLASLPESVRAKIRQAPPPPVLDRSAPDGIVRKMFDDGVELVHIRAVRPLMQFAAGGTFLNPSAQRVLDVAVAMHLLPAFPITVRVWEHYVPEWKIPAAVPKPRTKRPATAATAAETKEEVKALSPSKKQRAEPGHADAISTIERILSDNYGVPVDRDMILVLVSSMFPGVDANMVLWDMLTTEQRERIIRSALEIGAPG